MHWFTRLLLATLLVAAIAYVPRQIRRDAARGRVQRVEQERDQLQADNERLRQEIQEIYAEIQALKQDPSEVERIARQDLNLVRPGEVVFVLKPPAARNPAARP